jgi:hypothetical protein
MQDLAGGVVCHTSERELRESRGEMLRPLYQVQRSAF